MVNGINTKHIQTLTEEIWSSMLGIELSPTEVASPLGKKISACVQILGEWDGAVRLDCSEELVRQAAAAFTGLEPDEVEPEQVRDTAGELANMTGGGLKNMLPKPCSLSLPSVADGINFSLSVPHSKLVLDSAFTSESGALIVNIFERTDQ
jgi:CheY-specific phosphatase CheX